MNEENLFVIEFQVGYGDDEYVEHVALFNTNVIKEKEVRKLLKKGPFIYEHDPRFVVMYKDQYENLCK